MERYGNLCDKLNEFLWDIKYSFVSKDRALFVTENNDVYELRGCLSFTDKILK